MSDLSTVREAIVTEARSWIGTPWGHQQRQKGVMVDCAGLVTMTGRNTGLTTFDLRNYERQPNGTLLAICRRELEETPISRKRPGDVVALAYDGEPMHLGIVGPYPYGVGNLSLIHASNQRRVVCEHRIDAPLHRLIIAAFRFPGVPD